MSFKNIYQSLGITIFLCFIFNHTFSQSTKYKDFIFNWDTVKVTPIPIEEQFKDEDAVILAEETAIQFLQFENSITKHLRIKFLTQKGIADFSKIILPESYDPSFDYYDVPVEKRKKIHRPKGDNTTEEILYFAARIIKPNGSFVSAIVKDSLESEDFVFRDRGGTYYAYHFTTTNVSVNDEIEIFYKYSIPNSYFKEAYQHDRYFFNGTIPKQSCIFSVKYIDTHFLVFNSSATIQAVDSMETIENKRHFFQKTWIQKNLAGSINEVGARDYKDIPYISFYFHKRDFGILNDDGITFKKILPLTWPAYLFMYVHKNDARERTLLEIKDKSTLTLKHFFEDQVKMVGDSSSAVIKFQKIHQTFVDEFEYLQDKEFIEEKESRLERIQIFLPQKKLRYISRHTIYRDLMKRLNTDFYTVQFSDKRISEIDFNKYTPNNIIFSYYCLTEKGTPFFFYPKTHRFGYNTNELPFYLENTKSILIPQTVSEDAYRYKKNISFWNFTTYNSSEKQNYRNTNVHASIKLDSCKIFFDAKIALSGQFSTMTRGRYLYDFIDSTVNFKYHQRIFDISPHIKLLSQDTSNYSSDYPFPINFRIKYSSENEMLKKTSDTTYSLSIKNWFNHIIYDDFTARKRATDFYPDFKFLDSFKYYLQFDKNVEVVNQKGMEENITNALGAYKIHITQVQPNVIMLESFFEVNTELVPSQKVIDVENIFSKIQKINKDNLILKRVN